MTQAADRATPATLVKGPGLLPICVDLDGTLVRSDTLVDCISTGIHNWRVWRALFTLITEGRAPMKRQIAEIEPIHAPSLPYNNDVLEYLRIEKARGRKLILVTAADRRIAEAVNTHLRLFDIVLASDGVSNLKAERKALALVELFGEKGFVYAGNDRSDLAVWRHAKSAIIVNASRSVTAQAAMTTDVELQIKEAPSRASAILRALRPHQWVKNLLVFVPIATAHVLDDASAWTNAGWTSGWASTSG